MFIWVMQGHYVPHSIVLFLTSFGLKLFQIHISTQKILIIVTSFTQYLRRIFNKGLILIFWKLFGLPYISFGALKHSCIKGIIVLVCRRSVFGNWFSFISWFLKFILKNRIIVMTFIFFLIISRNVFFRFLIRVP